MTPSAPPHVPDRTAPLPFKVVKVVQKAPGVLRHDVDEVLEPHALWLEEIGLRDEALAKVLCRAPQVMWATSFVRVSCVTRSCKHASAPVFVTLFGGRATALAVGVIGDILLHSLRGRLLVPLAPSPEHAGLVAHP